MESSAAGYVDAGSFLAQTLRRLAELRPDGAAYQRQISAGVRARDQQVRERRDAHTGIATVSPPVTSCA